MKVNSKMTFVDCEYCAKNVKLSHIKLHQRGVFCSSHREKGEYTAKGWVPSRIQGESLKSAGWDAGIIKSVYWPRSWDTRIEEVERRTITPEWVNKLDRALAHRDEGINASHTKENDALGQKFRKDRHQLGLRTEAAKEALEKSITPLLELGEHSDEVATVMALHSIGDI
mgnify:CR=1 FL=1|tara:strand:+ start:27313 stop:27822 length:510 start_codon:yes stop_codon:yes gene_type:complete